MVCLDILLRGPHGFSKQILGKDLKEVKIIIFIFLKSKILIYMMTQQFMEIKIKIELTVFGTLKLNDEFCDFVTNEL